MVKKHPLFGNDEYNHKKSDLYPLLPDDPTIKDVYTKKKEDFEVFEKAWYWGGKYYDLISWKGAGKRGKKDKNKKKSTTSSLTWTTLNERKGVTVSVLEGFNDSSRLGIKRSMSIRSNMSEVLRHLIDVKIQEQIDDNISKLEAPKQISEESWIMHKVYKEIEGLKERDYVFSRTILPLDNDDIVIIDYNLEHEGGPVEKYIRGEYNGLTVINYVTDLFSHVTQIIDMDFIEDLSSDKREEIAADFYTPFEKLKLLILGSKKE